MLTKNINNSDDLLKIKLLIEQLYFDSQKIWSSANSLEQAYNQIKKIILQLEDKIVSKYDFLHPNKWGLKTAHYFYSLILHADFNKELQTKYLNWLKAQNLLSILDNFNLEKRIKNLPKDLNYLTKDEFLNLQKQKFGSKIVSIPYFSEFKHIKPFYTTSTLGNLSYKYDRSDNVLKNRQQLLNILKLNNKELISISLKSSDNIVIWPDIIKNKLNKYDYLEQNNPNLLSELGLYADAIIFKDLKNVKGAGILLGDCYAVMFFAPNKNIGALVHIGTPGLTLDLLGKVINKLKQEFMVNPNELYVIIGPGITKDNYFYENVDKFSNVRFWHGFINKINNKKYQIDLLGAIKNRLLELGIDFEKYKLTPADTYSHKYLYSHYKAYHLSLPDKRFFVGFVNR